MQAEPSAADNVVQSGRHFTLPAALDHPFRAVIFDWDGTAVTDRHEDATALITVAAALLRLKMWLVVVTGTNFGNIDRQFCSRLPLDHRRHLIVCTNRGSEVYGFGAKGATVRRWLQVATPDEDQKLTAIAEAVRDRLSARTGLKVRIVYDRLNRRKIDLIPVPEWADPPKAQLGALLSAVEGRLRAAGLEGGLGTAVRLSQQLAREQGLPAARITSDVKHIEVGLTDKGDSLRWIRRHLLTRTGIALADVLIGGDEFGPVAGFAGSDDRLNAAAEGAVVVSVGPEPNGAPAGVLHLGGGPTRFRALLAEQVRLHRTLAGEQRSGAGAAIQRALDAALTPNTEPAWLLEVQEYVPAAEHDVETRFALSNGFLGVRGSLEQPVAGSRPGTLVAGLFARLPDEASIPALAPGPDWLRLSVTVDELPLVLETGTTLEQRRSLDMRTGVLRHVWRHEDALGRRFRLRTVRFVSLADRALAVHGVEVLSERPLPLTVESWLEPPASGLLLERGSRDVGVWHAVHAEHQLAVASHVELSDPSGLVGNTGGAGVPRLRWSCVASAEHAASLVRLVGTARGGAADDPSERAVSALRRAQRLGLAGLYAAHKRAWAERWAASEVTVDGDTAAQQALRFALFHLIAAANPSDEQVSIGARGLTGSAYLGHVFWDTEIFLLPFYVLTWPEAARALLLYRFHTLPAALAKATRLGYRGALFAWESADTGEEATPPQVIGPDGEVIPIKCGSEEQHISAAVAHAVWQYWQATADDNFLKEAGAEILLETARFWASRALLEADGRHHIRGVIGPDEYHEEVDDNAYTNGMAAWNLERGLEVAQILQERWPGRWQALAKRLEITPEEQHEWQAAAATLAVEPRKDGVIEQFAGFFGLEPLDLAAFTPRTAPIDVILGRERTQHAQVVKQADVVMLVALLEDRYAALCEANFRYYEPRCAQGSSLSPAVHALVAARLGDVDLAKRYFDEAAAIDLEDRIGNAAGGLHMAALGGLWQVAVFGFAGLRLCGDGLRFEPHLPGSWQGLAFPVQWRGRRVRVELRREPLTIRVALERGRALMLHLGDLDIRLTPGPARRWRREERVAGGWVEESKA